MDQGYEDSRFENAVDGNFHCPICMDVLKEAMQCRRNEHYFCSPCIRRHLEQNSQSCPLCIDELTIETLRTAPRIVRDYLSSLKINCDYADRGCREIVELGVLESHVANCNFFPVSCSNDGCLEVINKQDVENHETKACGFKKLVKCDDCDEQFPPSKYTAHGCVLRREMVEMKGLQQQMMNEVKAMRQEMKCMTTQDLFGDHCPTNSREDIFAVGGFNEAEPVPFAERFSWLDRKWRPLPQMKENRSAAAAVMFENQILVCGGKTQLGIGSDSIEVMDMNQKPEQWLDFPAKLPLKCRGHQCVVYGNRLLLIGGYTNEDGASNGIYEVLLIPPYSSKLLCRMKQKRCYHGVELFDDKILIVGGKTSLENKDSLSNVEVYDVAKNECKEMPPLPSAVCSMATVGWDNNVILMGGVENSNISINTVIAYDIKTGESKVLPSMRNKRKGCAAVVSGNKIVVMGGFDGEEYLGSVDCFDFLSNSWNELPSMINRRYYITAV